MLASCRSQRTSDTKNIVLWWSEDAASRPFRFLAVGPGSFPRTNELWVYYAFEGNPAPGDWAYASHVRLHAMSPTARAAIELNPPHAPAGIHQLVMAADSSQHENHEMVDPAGSGYSQSWDESKALLAQRLADPIVAKDPERSGLWLSRMRSANNRVIIDIVPAGGIDVSQEIRQAPPKFWHGSIRFGVRAKGQEPQWCHGDPTPGATNRYEQLQVQLGQAAPVSLLAASLSWPIKPAEGALGCHWQDGTLHISHPSKQAVAMVVELRVPLHECHFPTVCKAWEDVTVGFPVGVVTMTTNLTEDLEQR